MHHGLKEKGVLRSFGVVDESDSDEFSESDEDCSDTDSTGGDIVMEVPNEFEPKTDMLSANTNQSTKVDSDKNVSTASA